MTSKATTTPAFAPLPDEERVRIKYELATIGIDPDLIRADLYQLLREDY